MKKILFVLAAVLMTGFGTAGCEKDEASLSNSEIEKMIVGKWFNWCTFYENHTFSMQNIGDGVWSIDGTVLKLKYNEEQSWGWYSYYYIESISEEYIDFAGWSHRISKDNSIPIKREP